MIHIADSQTDKILGFIPEDEFWDDVHKKSLKDTLETFDFTTFADREYAEHLAKRNRIIIPDEDGRYIEFIIENTRKYRDTDGSLFIEVYSVSSYLELAKAKTIEPQTLSDQTPNMALGFALEGTGWVPGRIEGSGTRTFHIDQYTNPYSFTKTIATEYKLERNFRVEHDGNKITGRFLDLVERVGMWRGREVEFGKDLIGIERKEDFSNIVTALIGLGPEREDGTRLQVFVEDKDALARWGRNGQHLVEVYEPQSTDSTMTEEQLRTLTENELEKRVNSVVSYRADIADLEKVPGLEHERIRFGDTIKIKDTAFSPPLYLEARVHTQERSIKRNGRKTVELGDYIEYTEEEVFAIWKSLQAEIAKKVSMTEVMEVTYDKQTIDTKDNTVYDNSKSYADDAKQEAITVSATDATNKANQAEQNAKSHADTVAEQKKQEAIQQAQSELNQVKTELETDIAEKADATWVEGQLQSKADKADTYTKTEVDNALNSKVSVTQYTTDINGIVTDLESVESRVSQTESEIATKVSNTTYQQDKQVIEGNISSLETRIDNAETSITQNANQIALKANATDVYTKTEIDGQFSTVNQEITDIEAELSVQADEIALKVSQTEFETFQTKALIDKGNAPNVDWNTIQETGIYNVDYGSNPKPTNFPQGAYGWGTLIVERSSVGTVTQTYKAHSTPPRTYYRMNYGGNESNWRDWQEVTRKADFDALEGRVTTAESTITQHADMIATKVSQTELDTAIDGVQVGGRNLISNSGSFKNTSNWMLNGGSNLQVVTKDGFKCLSATGSVRHADVPLENGTEYVYSAEIMFDMDVPVTQSAPLHYWINTPGQSGTGGVDGSVTLEGGNRTITANTWHKIVLRFKTKPIGDFVLRPIIYKNPMPETWWLKYIKLEKGNKATDWTPAPEDVDAEISGIDTRLSTAESTITQHASEIESKVSYTDYTGNEIASRINQTATTVLLQAQKIALDGYVEAKHIKSLNGLNVNDQFIVDSQGNVSISNDKVTLSKDGIKVKDGDFMLEDNVSEMPYSIVAKANMVRDHSFELLLRDESTYDYQYHWCNIRMKHMYDNHWYFGGSPKVVFTEFGEDPNEYPIFGWQAVAVRSGSYLMQIIPASRNVTYTLSAHFKRHWNTPVGGTPRLEVWRVDALGNRVVRLADRIFNPVPSDYSVVRHSITFTTPADMDPVESIEIVIHGGNSIWVQCDGVQLVEGNRAGVYSPDDATWEIIKGDYNVTPDNRDTILWNGASYPNGSTTIRPDKYLSECTNGWVLLWSYWDGSAAGNYRFVQTHVHKSLVGPTGFPGLSTFFPIPLSTTGQIAVKTLYISNDKIVGHDDNMSTLNRAAVLRRIYEY